MSGLKAIPSYFGRDRSANSTIDSAALIAIIVFVLNIILAAVVQMSSATQSQIDFSLQIVVVILRGMGVSRKEQTLIKAISKAVAEQLAAQLAVVRA